MRKISAPDVHRVALGGNRPACSRTQLIDPEPGGERGREDDEHHEGRARGLISNSQGAASSATVGLSGRRRQLLLGQSRDFAAAAPTCPASIL